MEEKKEQHTKWNILIARDDQHGPFEVLQHCLNPLIECKNLASGYGAEAVEKEADGLCDAYFCELLRAFNAGLQG
jgi:hypothetical protein